MNGLFYDPLRDQIIDYVGGREDLEAGMVRAIGDPYQRIAEDKLRMLRADRFAVTFGFQIDRHTEAAVRSEAERITVVSAERIATEIRKMLVHPHRRRAVELLRYVNLLPVLLPESRALWDSEAAASSTGNGPNWESTLGILGRLERPSFRVALAGLLWGINANLRDADVVKSICARWRLTNHEKNGVLWMLQREPLVRNAQSVAWPVLQRTLIAAEIEELLQLAEAIAMEVNGSSRQIDFCRRKLRLPPDQLNPPLLITGNELRRAGFRSGPLYRQVLQQVRDAQLEGKIDTPEQALELAAAIAEKAEKRDEESGGQKC